MKDKLIEFFKGIGTIFLYFLLASIGNLLLGNYYHVDNIFISSLAQIGTYLLILVGLGLIYFKKIKEDFKNFKKDYIKVAVRNWAFGLMIMVISNIILNLIVGNIASNEALNRVSLQKYPISSLFTMVLIGPFIEEITFRLSFKKAFDKWYTFALVTGLLFGGVHILSSIQTGSFIECLYIIPYGALGFFFAKALYETDNVFTSYFAHFSHNLLCILILLLV